MPTDAMIPLMGRPVPSPLEGIEAAQRLQIGQQQMQVGQLQLQEIQRQQQAQQVIDRVMQQSMNADGTINRDAMQKGIVGGGYGHLWPQYQQVFNNLDEAKAKLDESRAKAEEARESVIGNALHGVVLSGYQPGAAITAIAGLHKNGFLDADKAQQYVSQIMANPTTDYVKSVVDPMVGQSPTAQKLANELKVAEIRAGGAGHLNEYDTAALAVGVQPGEKPTQEQAGQILEKVKEGKGAVGSPEAQWINTARAIALRKNNNVPLTPEQDAAVQKDALTEYNTNLKGKDPDAAQLANSLKRLQIIAEQQLISGTRPTADKLVKVEHQDPATGQTVIEWLPQSEVKGQVFRKGLPGAEQTRADSAQANYQTGQDIIRKLSDPKVAAQVGPVLGRYNSLKEFLGNPPPEYKELAGQIESYALSAMSVHGMRNAQAARDIAAFLNGKQTPESMAAGVRGLQGFSKHLLQNLGRPVDEGGSDKTPDQQQTGGAPTYQQYLARKKKP